MTLTWGDWIETGVLDIDNEHKLIMELYNRAIRAINDRLSNEDIDSIVTAFCIAIKTNFRTEEEIMLAMNYEHTLEHINHHNNLLYKIDYLIESLKYRDTVYDSISVVMIEFIAQHIDLYDAKLAAFIKGVDIPDNNYSPVDNTEHDFVTILHTIWKELNQ